MAHLILTGATGLIGGAALNYMLPLTTNGTISKLSILSRREIPVVKDYDNVKTIIVKDFGNLDSKTLDELKGASACVWGLGISQTQVSKEDYVKIHVDWPLNAAQKFSKLNDNFRFIYISGEGATAEPGRFTAFFGKTKGQAEQQLITLAATTPSLETISVRPAGVDKSQHPELQAQLQLNGHKQPAFVKYLEPVFPLLRSVMPSMMTPTKILGKFLTDLALEKDKYPHGEGVLDGGIVTNAGLLRLAKEDAK